ncbi:MAG: DUF554 domain-containing protein [Eggerthellaceae bacterium]|nr:DUF554 domain-containing protein [Eggerthellaceae bacterium]
MPGLGTIINVFAIVAGGALGSLAGSRLGDRVTRFLTVACGAYVIYLGASGAIEGLLSSELGQTLSENGIVTVASLLGGTLVGTLANIDGRINQFGAWLRDKTGNEADRQFVEAFVSASLTVCVGAMAVIGAIEDGIAGDHSILFTKAFLDFIIILAMSASLGRDCAFSALPVGVFQGSITALAVLLKPLATALALANISMVGAVLIGCVGVNLVFKTHIPVANMLPAIIIAPACAFL